MRLSRHRRLTRAEMNMTPMIDVVFLLLIFFMTVSQVSAINSEQIPLPKLKGSADQQPVRLTINVLQSGELRVSGETVTVASLVTAVRDELARLSSPDLLTVVIRADERGNSAAVNRVMRALSEMGITRVRIAVEMPS